MLKRPPRAKDVHEDSLVLLKNVGNSNFQGVTLVNAVAGNGLYPLLYAKYVAIIYKYFFPCNKLLIFLSLVFIKKNLPISIIIACHLKDSFIMWKV